MGNKSSKFRAAAPRSPGRALTPFREILTARRTLRVPDRRSEELLADSALLRAASAAIQVWFDHWPFDRLGSSARSMEAAMETLRESIG